MDGFPRCHTARGRADDGIEEGAAEGLKPLERWCTAAPGGTRRAHIKEAARCVDKEGPEEG